MLPSQLVAQVGGAYSRELGIDLPSGKPGETFKWFLASILFGARISETLAERTYHEFEREHLLAPKRILDAGWDRLVEVLDHGGYTRYDFKTATKLLDVNHALVQEYKGDLNTLHAAAADPADLERRIRSLGKGIGEVTANIFLRELRGVWPLARPLLSERAIQAARALHFIPAGMHDRKRILEKLEETWHAEGMAQKTFVDFEAALVRYAIHAGKNHRMVHAKAHPAGKSHRTHG